MATSQLSTMNSPLYSSWEDLKDGLKSGGAGVALTPQARRLFWRLDGDFPAAISVMKTDRAANELAPFFEAAGGTWHEIAQLPLTQPKVSSIDATLCDFRQWETNWVNRHSEHTGPQHNPEYIMYGDLSDENRPYAKEPNDDGNWEEDSNAEFLVACCGEDRPMRKRDKKLTVKPSADNDFVTVYDYVSVVHLWIMGMRNDIMDAKKVEPFTLYPDPTTKEWMVWQGPYRHVEEKESWVRSHGGGSPRVLPATTVAFLEKLRRERNKRSEQKQ